MDEQGGVRAACLHAQTLYKTSERWYIVVSINYGNTSFSFQSRLCFLCSFLADPADLSADHPSSFIDDD